MPVNDWTKIGAYLEIKSWIDPEYARLLFTACVFNNSGAYEWLEFCDQCGIDDPGDYCDDVDPS